MRESESTRVFRRHRFWRAVDVLCMALEIVVVVIGVVFLILALTGKVRLWP
jgi:hypothetical protein